MTASLKSHLKDEDYKKLKDFCGREPNNIEIALALALWNEHCSYKSSKAHLKNFQFSTKKQTAAIGENAGIVDLGQGERVAFKMESHNHPSYIIPYHGAATGVGGILRDIFAMNARPLLLADYLCFGEPETAQGNSWRVDGVVRGIGDYGNSMGLPTLNGCTEFSACYNGNILVNAMALGFLGSQDKAMSSKACGQGYFVVYAGSSTGRDGVLGASMASDSFGEGEQAKPTVQIGDPFFGKQLMEACLLAMKKNLIAACQDMGAAGLTSSSFEMASKGGVGLSLHLDRVPLRDLTMKPEDILLSESQERMLFICKPSCWKELKTLFESYQLEAHVLGEVLKTPEIELYWQDSLLLKINPQSFSEAAFISPRPYQIPDSAPRISLEEFFLPQKNLQNLLIDILQSPNGRNRRFIYEQYDQRVGTNTVKDASYPISVIKLPESGRFLGVAMGCRNPLMEIDVKTGAQDACFYPALQLALRGFDPWAVTDCLNFGNPEKPLIMGEFVLSVQTLAHSCKLLDVPVISGNVSFYNEQQDKNITPTPAVAMIGLKATPSPLPPAHFVQEKERVFLLSSHQFFWYGSIKKHISELKSKKEVYGALQGEIVQLFIQNIKKIQSFDFFSSSCVVGKFGLSYTLARMVLQKGVGFVLDESFPFSLWGERLYEVIVSVPAQKEKTFKDQTQKLGLDCVFMGETRGTSLKLKRETWTSHELKEAYCKSWEDMSL